jgi:hypothetical protein
VAATVEVEAAPVEVFATPAPEPVVTPIVAPAAPVLVAKKDKSHTADPGNLQQTADVNSEPEVEAETPEAINLPTIQVNKARSVQYEQDLNSARDQIIKAQSEMKNIDSEVQNFHQKMALSMHSLLKAFTEGFEAMDKAKEDEVTELRNKKEAKRVQKFDKVHSGIDNLEALTSQLKMSFDDEEV